MPWEGSPHFVHLGSLQLRTQSHGPVSNLTECNARPMNHQRVHIRQIVLENRFFRKKCQTWTVFPDTESPPKYFILENLGNPDSLPKATCPTSPKLPRLGNLGTIGEGHFVSTPARPIKDRPLLTMISSFENICVLIPVY